MSLTRLQQFMHERADAERTRLQSGQGEPREHTFTAERLLQAIILCITTHIAAYTSSAADASLSARARLRYSNLTTGWQQMLQWVQTPSSAARHYLGLWLLWKTLDRRRDAIVLQATTEDSTDGYDGDILCIMIDLYLLRRREQGQSEAVPAHCRWIG
jgi:hypothetical protein